MCDTNLKSTPGFFPLEKQQNNEQAVYKHFHPIKKRSWRQIACVLQYCHEHFSMSSSEFVIHQGCLKVRLTFHALMMEEN